MFWDFFLLLILIFLNAALAMSEIAIVSAKKARLQKRADEGNARAALALALANEPSSFLSTVQVGITVVGISSGAIGEGAFTEPLAAYIAAFLPLAPYAKTLATVLVVALLTWFSVVIGELVPKRLGLFFPETIAAWVARPMRAFARFARPVVWFFSSSSSLILKLLRISKSDAPPVTDEEINVLMEQGAEAGVFHESEQAIVSNVLQLDEQKIAAIMTPRSDMYVLDMKWSDKEQLSCVAASPYTRLVVCEGGFDKVLGILRIADLAKRSLLGEAIDIPALISSPLYVPEGLSTAHLLENFRHTRAQCALVVDEYGEIQGMVTLTDVLIAIVGDVPSSHTPEETDIIERADGSWLVEGGIALERVRSFFDLREKLPGEDKNAFHTLAGLALYLLGKIPKTTDHFFLAGYRFEIVDMDGHRIDKILVERQKDVL